MRRRDARALDEGRLRRRLRVGRGLHGERGALVVRADGKLEARRCREDHVAAQAVRVLRGEEDAHEAHRAGVPARRLGVRLDRAEDRDADGVAQGPLDGVRLGVGPREGGADRLRRRVVPREAAARGREGPRVEDVRPLQRRRVRHFELDEELRPGGNDLVLAEAEYADLGCK